MPIVPKRTFDQGWTLIELVIVIIVLSLLAATVAIRVSKQTDTAVVFEADKLRRNLSHVQALAIGWGARLRVATAADGLSYSVTCQTALGSAPCTSVGSAVTDPATGSAFAVTLASGVSISPVSTNLDFDSLGRPATSTALIASDPAVTFTLTDSTRTVTVTVAPVTGFAVGTY